MNDIKEHKKEQARFISQVQQDVKFPLRKQHKPQS